MVSKRSGFTLLELCLAIAIGVIILSVALPSLGWLFSERRLKGHFEAFDALAAKAQELSMSRRKSYFLVWDKTGITLVPEDAANKEEAAGISHPDIAPH